MSELKVQTHITETGVHQVRDVLGEITHVYVNLCAKQMDDAVRDKLIELGWTPPPEKGNG